jgi:hypothetical protein
MNWPHREGMLVHIAAPASDAGEQRCSRCSALLHRSGTGSTPPWSPGRYVAVSDSGMVRMAVNPPFAHPECQPATEPADGHVPAAA